MERYESFEWRFNQGNYIGLATLFQIYQATLYADNELTNTQLTVYLLAEQDKQTSSDFHKQTKN